MKQPLCLDGLSIGQRAVVTGLCREDPMRRRLRELGMIEGTVVECVGKSPFGDPSAYLIRGAVIALRRQDCHGITVIPLEEGGSTLWD
ncbi:MAG: ferrous iron transport protein A [Clostridia bacterium]|nr:ferrous iron transport protein A [Clostridia bacterium]